MAASHTRHHATTIRFGKYHIRLPGTRGQRTWLGIGFCIGGVLGFLPVVGFWMLPLGILVLSVDYHPVRRLRRRFQVWMRRRRKRTDAKRA